MATSGEGKTPARVVELLQSAVKESSQIAVARASGVGLYSIQRFLKGTGEPTQATLEKLAAYFGKSVGYLRGDLIDLEDFFDSPDIKGIQSDLLVILEAAAALGKKTGWHDELLTITDATTKISRAIGIVAAERIDLRGMALDEVLEKHEDRLTRIIDAEDARRSKEHQKKVD